MAISIKDIREKDFSTERNGYNCDEVDDFLDELAAQTEELAKEQAHLEVENRKANAEIASLRKALADAKAEAEEAVKAAEKAAKEAAEEAAANVPAVQEAAPTFNEPSYFKNLETTLRETLISAQRIADETIDEANKQASKIVSDAENEAARLKAESDEALAKAQAESDERLAKAQADYEGIVAAGKSYHSAFRALVEEQNRLLNESSLNAEN